MDQNNQLYFFFQFLQETEKELSKEDEKQIMIENAINLRLMCDYVVSCSYSDIVLIICMLRDYVQMLDKIRDDIQWKVYYRAKFMDMAARLSAQIEYDYDAAVEKCRKKLGQKEKTEDIGADADVMTLSMKYGRKKKNDNKKEREEHEKNNKTKNEQLR